MFRQEKVFSFARTVSYSVGKLNHANAEQCANVEELRSRRMKWDSSSFSRDLHHAFLRIYAFLRGTILALMSLLLLPGKQSGRTSVTKIVIIDALTINNGTRRMRN